MYLFADQSWSFAAKKNRYAAATGVAALAALTSCAGAQQPAPVALGDAVKDRPNIVFILADDLGWMDTGVYGSTFYKTPNIDKLAERGMWFSRAYTANPLCSPTRASILTGQYPGRLHLTAPQGHLEAERLTVALPKNAPATTKVVTPLSLTRLPLSYNTLGQSFKAAGYATGFMGKWHLGPDPYIPENFGFDTVIGGGPFPGPPSFFSPYHMKQYLSDGPPGEHIDERLGKEATKFIEANRDKLFLLNVWSYDVHAPFQARADYIKQFRATVDPKNPQHSPTYAAMVKSTDDLVGTVVAALDRMQLTEKTMIIFYSDNGGNMYDTVDGTTPTDNWPLRNGKGSIWEGGSRVPLIVSWPGHVRPGSKSDALVSSIDFYPTLLGIAGAKGKEGQIVDGVDIRPVLEETGKLERDTIYCHFPHDIPATNTPASVYVHQRDWKLIRIFAGNADQSDQFELYDLASDESEKHNLAAQMPDKVRELDALISQHLKETGALVPFANPNYRGPGAIIKGWSADGDATLESVPDGLKVVSAGGDPFFKVSDLPDANGPFKVKMRFRTDIEGDGLVFWAEARKGFSPARRMDFPITRDGKWHEYTVALPVESALQNLRIDPGTAQGAAIFAWIRLYDKDEKLVRAWEFNPK